MRTSRLLCLHLLTTILPSFPTVQKDVPKHPSIVLNSPNQQLYTITASSDPRQPDPVERTAQGDPKGRKSKIMPPSLPQFSAARMRSYIFRLPLFTRGI